MRHSNSEFAAIAEHHTILRTEVGSGVHGLGVGSGDRDEMGICLEPPEFIVGLRKFEQYQYRTAAERTGVQDARSEPGDLDLTVYCHDPDSRVLTTTLEWVPISKLGVGDKLVTFDEGATTRARHRHFSTGTVAATQTRIMDRVRVETSRGPTIVTPEHAFLVRFENKPRTRWVRADQLQPGQQIYFLSPWDTDRSWEAGYLAGQFDGDGSLHFFSGPNYGSSHLSWAQKAGRPCVSFVENVMASLNLHPRIHHHPANACDYVHVGGDWTNQLRFLGSVRPQRLLRHPELPRMWEARSLQACERAVVGEVVPLPAGPMVAMEVDTRTYIADGFLTHNSARKWLRLALDGNPTVLTPLFAPAEAIVDVTTVGLGLRAQADMIVSRQAGHRFLGYLHGQRQRMLNGNVHARVNRPELVEKYGHDTKYAAHMVRLAVQGVELLETGRLTLPMAEPWRTWIRDLRQGKHTQQEALDATEELEARLTVLTETADLPKEPDVKQANRWLIDTYQQAWARGRWVA